MIQNIFIFCNMSQRFLMFFHQRFDFQTNQLIQPHFQNRSCLPFCKLQFLRLAFTGFCFKSDSLGIAIDQTFYHLFPIFAPPKDLNDQIDHITGFYQPLLHFLLVFFLCQKCLIFSGCNLKLKVYMIFYDLFQT